MHCVHACILIVGALCFSIMYVHCYGLTDLYHKTTDETAKRDYLYYLSVGHCRLKVSAQWKLYNNCSLQSLLQVRREEYNLYWSVKLAAGIIAFYVSVHTTDGAVANMFLSRPSICAHVCAGFAVVTVPVITSVIQILYLLLFLVSSVIQ